ncbi:MAG: protein kinase [Lentisphaeraceae bacterium]|nr:protein kinase [Lentisphaeraceae bacterium]
MDNSRILVVDDNEITRKYMTHLLKLEGYENIVEADCGTDVLEMFKECSVHENKMFIHEQNSIDLAILDIMLGDMMGYTVCEKLKEYDSSIPVMCVSAIDDIENEMNIVKSGADAFELKPLDSRMFVLRVKKLLEKRKENIRLISNYESLKEVHKNLPAFVRTKTEQIGRYMIEEQCGKGSSSIVYKCRLLGGQHTYALKILHEEVAHEVENIVTFREEIENLLCLDHPNITKFIEHGIHEGFPYYVMEYASGQTLADMVIRGPISIEQGFHILRSLSDALDYIHDKHIVHRDIKLENIMISDSWNILLTDFGLSMSEDIKRTSVHGLVGTPLYIAPEIIVHGAESAKSDIYAFGVTMYYLMTGQPPYSGATLAELVHQHCTFVPPRVDEVRPELSPSWGDLIARCLDKKPENRPDSLLKFVSRELFCR